MMKTKAYEYLNGISSWVSEEYVGYNIDVWNKNKELLRQKLFGQKLKLQKKIEIKSNAEIAINENYSLYKEIENDLRDVRACFVNQSANCPNKEDGLCTFICEHYDNINYLCCRGAFSLFTTLCFNVKILVNNSFDNGDDGFPFLRNGKGIYFTSTGKMVKFDKTTKPIRLARKIIKEECSEIALEKFDKVVQKISQLTQKARTITGTLTLSIDPLDYLTASDNNFGWTSCQSVVEGSYSCGVLSVMNSEHTFMAYFTPEGRDFYNKEFEIADKMWRTWVTYNGHDFIIHKNYPYQHEALNEEVVKMVSEATQKEFAKHDFVLSDWLIEAGLMYPDFRCDNKTKLYLEVGLNKRSGRFAFGTKDVKLVEDGTRGEDLYDADTSIFAANEDYDDDDEW